MTTARIIAVTECSTCPYRQHNHKQGKHIEVCTHNDTPQWIISNTHTIPGWCVLKELKEM